MVKDFVFKVGHAATVAFIINMMTEIDDKGKVTKGVDKATARIVVDITNILGLNTPLPVQSMDDPFELKDSFSSLHSRWIKEQINAIFDAKMMPLQFAKYALDIVDNWE
jgi:hypothetical protein